MHSGVRAGIRSLFGYVWTLVSKIRTIYYTYARQRCTVKADNGEPANVLMSKSGFTKNICIKSSSGPFESKRFRWEPIKGKKGS